MSDPICPHDRSLRTCLDCRIFARQIGVDLDGLCERSARKPARKPESPWRPISTAPRDGTRVLVYDEKGFVEPARRRKDWPHWMRDDNTEMVHDRPKGWQPLPAAPETGGEG